MLDDTVSTLYRRLLQKWIRCHSAKSCNDQTANVWEKNESKKIRIGEASPINRFLLQNKHNILEKPNKIKNTTNIKQKQTLTWCCSWQSLKRKAVFASALRRECKCGALVQQMDWASCVVYGEWGGCCDHDAFDIYVALVENETRRRRHDKNH